MFGECVTQEKSGLHGDNLTLPFSVGWTWLISNSCQEDMFSTDITPAIKTDHSAITLIFKQVSDHKPGPSYWKFNSSLVDDSKYIDFIKSSYQFHLASGRQKSDAMSYRHWKEKSKDGRICVMSHLPRKI